MMGNDLKIADVGDGLVQFKFSLESQLVWVLNNGPWSFNNHLLLLRQGEGDDGILRKFSIHAYLGPSIGLLFDLIN